MIDVTAFVGWGTELWGALARVLASGWI